MKKVIQMKLVDILNKQGTITNGEIMECFKISIETTRWDLSYLEKQGLFECVYGGPVGLTVAAAAKRGRKYASSRIKIQRYY